MPAEMLQWFAVSTRSRHEKQVAKQLAAKSIEHWLPLYDAVHQWKNGRQRVQLPLFPGYLFVRMQAAERLQVLNVMGVAYIVGSRLGPTPINELEIGAIRGVLNSNLTMEPRSYVTVGERVRVCSGPLAGCEGILVRNKDDLRVVLSIDLIMRSVAVELDGHDVEPLMPTKHLMVREAEWEGSCAA
jgi:transcription antitermination factor NusG